jgi:hypothetical protein
VPLPYDTVPDASWDHLGSWAGLPRGQLWAYDIPFALAPAGGESLVSRPVKLRKPIAGAAAVVLAYSAGSGPRPAVLFAGGTRAAVDPSLEALAWRAWPPIYTARLLMAPVPVRGKKVVGIDPGGRAVWAMSLLGAAPSAPALAALASGRAPAPWGRMAEANRGPLAALRQGAAEWQRTQRLERAIAQLGRAAARVRQGSFAVLPPAPHDSTNLLVRAGLPQRGVMLSPDQLIDPAFFNARRFPVALYADGEEYLHTVHTPGDAADAVVRYVHEGGTLLLLAPGPFPMYVARGPGFSRPDPLTVRLGLPLYNAIETPPHDRLAIAMVPGQTVLRGVPPSLPYPPGDPRLRSIDRRRVPPEAKYTPIYTVRGASGQDYGDAAGLIEFPNGGGRILYVWGGLLRDPDHDFPIAEAAVRSLIQAAR